LTLTLRQPLKPARHQPAGKTTVEILARPLTADGGDARVAGEPCAANGIPTVRATGRNGGRTTLRTCS
jgi:hypothetical protein